jgi:hypothetical protein
MRSTISLVAITLLATLVAACGDDPVSSGSGDTTMPAAYVRLTPAQIEYDNVYDPVAGETAHHITWRIDNAALRGYAPGKRIRLKFTFDPPLVVRRAHTDEFFTARTPQQYCTDRFDEPVVDFSSLGDWTNTEFRIRCMGACQTGASIIQVDAGYGPLEEGETLSVMMFEFTVADTYSSGSGGKTPILPADFNGMVVTLAADTPGDSTDDPPVWQGTYSPPTAAVASGSVR